MGCKFCASGLLKKKRNLTSCEIVQEIVGANKYLKENNLQPMGSISFMGIGEPFDNIENVIATVKLLNDKKTLNISTRNFTLSTCGLIDKLPLIIKELPQTNVAISLHAPTDEIRSRIMPVNNAFNVKQVIDAAKDYTKKTRNDITFQYALMQGINDSNECAEQLSKLLKDVNCHVTLIEYNENPEFDIHASKNVANFKNILKKNNISFSQRLKRGKDIDAACGTMRANYDKSKK
jgi:23S rRNA (adenine2503-C2)-methyltransferase